MALLANNILLLKQLQNKNKNINCKNNIMKYISTGSNKMKLYNYK